MVAATSISIAELWQPWRWPARLVVASFAVTQFMLATAFIVTSHGNYLSIFSMALVATAFVLLSVHWGSMLPVRVAILIDVLVAATMLIEAPSTFVDDSVNSDWQLGALVGVLLATMLWGRVLCAWIGFVLVAGIQIVASLIEGVGIVVTVPVLLRHAATLAIAAFMVFALRRIAAALSENALIRQQRDTDEIVRAVLANVRTDQFNRLDEVAGGLLRRIASGRPLSDSERQECLLAEAGLRDGLSANALATADVRNAAFEARKRGVHVTLIDDSGGLNPHAELAAAALVRELDALNAGSCMARLLPIDRDAVASIMVDSGSGDVRVVEVMA